MSPMPYILVSILMNFLRKIKYLFSFQDVSFVMCLDSISSSPSMTMHVSKPPKPGGAAHSIKSRLGVSINHKKINLAEELLAWQHERFSIRRMTAFTLSSLQVTFEARNFLSIRFFNLYLSFKYMSMSTKVVTCPSQRKSIYLCSSHNRLKGF